jgi:hypothetical protein
MSLPGMYHSPDDQPGIGCLGLIGTALIGLILAAAFLAMALYATSVTE